VLDAQRINQADRARPGRGDPGAYLRAVLANDELALFCQPIRALHGAAGYPLAEALVRLRSEENALLPPGDFDGFGSNAVSLASLKTLRPRFIKVGGAISRQVLASAAAAAKMKAIVCIGKALGFGVIAECVEDQDVLACLSALGVGYAQGFGIHKPHPIGQFPAAAAA
jgi:EAL domain-containing protein (putative c-di-GMP-specific phosphodiesterase class I)